MKRRSLLWVAVVASLLALPPQAQGAVDVSKLEVTDGQKYLSTQPPESKYGTPNPKCMSPSFTRHEFSVAGYPWRQAMVVNTRGVPLGLDAFVSALRGAARAWNDENNACARLDKSSFEYSHVGQVDDVPIPDPDGRNTIMFAPRSLGLCGSAEAVSCVYSYTDEETGRHLEFDIVLISDFPWSTTGRGLDLQSVITHELGHAAGLDHVSTAIPCDPKHMFLVMSPCIWPGDTSKRVLSLGDALGIEQVSASQW